MHVRNEITVDRPPSDVYEFWRKLENLPRFMEHLQAVEQSGQRSHWTARAPAGLRVEWDAEIVDDDPGKLIRWRSLPESDVDNAGTVQFLPAKARGATQVVLDLDFEVPAGRLGTLAARLLGNDPDREIHDDLQRLKRLMETAPDRTGSRSG
jgi:uncharacterized membrane protein